MTRPVRAAARAAGVAALADMDPRPTVVSRRVARDHATEFGASEQSWRDSTGGRTAEYGRSAAAHVRQGDGGWRMDRCFGCADPTRPARARR
jgi:hypothetical protein